MDVLVVSRKLPIKLTNVPKIVQRIGIGNIEVYEVLRVERNSLHVLAVSQKFPIKLNLLSKLKDG